MVLFVVLVVAVAILGARRKPRAARLLYSQGKLVDNFAVFSCGCRFNWARPTEPATICAAHKSIIDAEVAA